MSVLPVPAPKPHFLVGNLPDLQGRGILGVMELAKALGPIYRLQFPGENLTIVSSQELVDELSDETRFGKKVHAPLFQLREFMGDGLITSHTVEPAWGSAHRILMSAFGPAALTGMFDDMLDVAEQLLLKWERQGPEHVIDLADDATRLTLDTIALCSFSYRFNNFYSDRVHPLVEAMNRILVEAQRRSGRLPLQNRLRVHARHQFDEDRRAFHEVVDQLIAERRRRPLPKGHRDILETMLHNTDPSTGERLPDENVRHQLATFLVAGHETTSGLLSFTLYELLSNPEVLARACDHVRDVLGDRTPRAEDISRLDYIDRVLREALRLWPPVPGFALTPLEDTVLDSGHAVSAGETIIVFTPGLHRDPQVWDEPETFDPDRFTFERAQTLPPNSWKPFGNGARACIGRGFALQELTLFVAMLLQRFEVTAADPDYDLALKEAMSIKPDGFRIRVRRRPAPLKRPSAEMHEETRGKTAGPQVGALRPGSSANGVPIRVLYGSNAGTCETFARRVAEDARRRGYTASVDTLDSGAGHLPSDGAVIIVCSSYEGTAPENARTFITWLAALKRDALSGVRYAVFGCGDRNWARTYQAVPTSIDTELARAGATRLRPRGEGNIHSDYLGAFEDWNAALWAPVAAALGQTDQTPTPTPTVEVEFVETSKHPGPPDHDLSAGTVVVNRELTVQDGPHRRSRRHIEIALPEGVSYHAGDYLVVAAANPPALVDRALIRFSIAYDAILELHSPGGHSGLPLDTPVAAGDLLARSVELAQPASRQQVETLANLTACPPEQSALRALVQDTKTHAREVLEKHLSVLDLLERNPSCGLSFAAFLQTLTPLAPRRYSISSSPRWSPNHVSLTVAVVSAPARAGTGVFEGVASTYLARSHPGTRVTVTVRPPNVAFHPPASLATPIVMACAGTGIAPFRAFLQDRALRADAEGVTPAPALLFFGCTDPAVDYLYRDELDSWAAAGVVETFPAFSRAPINGIRYVQEQIWTQRTRIGELVDNGAIFFVCGDGARMAPAVFDTCTRIYADTTGVDHDTAQKWMAAMQRDHGRYIADTYA